MGRRNLICRCKEKSVILTNVHLHRSSTECRMIHHFSDLPEKASKCWPPWWKLHWWEVNLSTLDKNKIKIIVFVGYGVLKTFDKKMIPPEGCSNDASHRLSDQQIFVLWTNALLQSPWFRIWNCEMWNGVLCFKINASESALKKGKRTALPGFAKKCVADFPHNLFHL